MHNFSYKIINTSSALDECASAEFFTISAELRMFRKFDEKESISAVSQLKTSVQKGIRNQVMILAKFNIMP